jgi:hypothetical protein
MNYFFRQICWDVASWIGVLIGDLSAEIAEIDDDILLMRQMPQRAPLPQIQRHQGKAAIHVVRDIAQGLRFPGGLAPDEGLAAYLGRAVQHPKAGATSDCSGSMPGISTRSSTRPT